MLAELYVLSGRDAGKVLAAKGPTIFIGRAATNHLRLRDPQASRVHCRIDVTTEGLTLEDVNSGNGTVVNGERVASRDLEDGDEILLGETRVKVLIETEEERERWVRNSEPSDMAQVDPRPPSEQGSAIDREEAEDTSIGEVLPEEADETTEAETTAAEISAYDDEPDAAEDALEEAPEPEPEPVEKPTRRQVRELTPMPKSRRELREVLPGYMLEGRLGGRSRQGIAVYRANQRSLDRPVALKIFLPKGPTKRQDVQRFLREAKAIARLPHPNIVTIHDVLERGKMRVIVMEYMAGGSLADRLDEGNPLDLGTLLLVGEAIGGALSYLHAQGVVHRNLKPSNVLRARGHATFKLAGLGFATGPVAERQGDTCFLSGPPDGFAFLAPEQLGQDLSRIDARTDVYALGATLYGCAAGGPPFTAETVTELAASVLRDDPPPLEGVPVALQTVVRRAMRKDPDDRYENATALLHELRACRASLDSGSMRSNPA